MVKLFYIDTHTTHTTFTQTQQIQWDHIHNTYKVVSCRYIFTHSHTHTHTSMINLKFHGEKSLHSKTKKQAKNHMMIFIVLSNSILLNKLCRYKIKTMLKNIYK